MKAVVQEGFGGGDQLHLRDRPDPVAGPGQLVVRVAAAGINPVDWKMREGRLFRVELPVIPGSDVSGTVLEVGQRVTGFHPGDEVLGYVEAGYAEKVAAAAERFAIVPDGLDLVDAAALPVVSLTGAQLADTVRGCSRVLVTGALGSVGRVAVFEARRNGAHVLAGVRRSQLDQARQLGADEVVAIDDEAAVSSLPELDAIADTVGGPTIARLLPRIRKGGLLGSVVGEPAAAKGRDLTVHAIRAHPDPTRLRELAEAVERGELVVPVGRRFPLAEVGEAQALAEKGGIGKVVLVC